MPYKAFKEGNNYKVYKVTESGEKTGDALGIHDSKAKADEQVKALYAAENKEEDTEEKMMDYPEEKMEVEIHVGGPTSLKDMMKAEQAEQSAYKVMDLAGKFVNVVKNIMGSGEERKDQLLIKASGEFAEMARNVAKPQNDTPFTDNKEISNEQAKSQLVGDKSKEKVDDNNLFIWKENGQYRWIAAYSNNRRDNDNPPEIISSDSHKQFDEGLAKGLYPMPELWLWHLPYRVGITHWHAYDEQKGFPIAAGTFDKDKGWVAEAIINNPEWSGVSHGMPKSHIKRDEKDKTIITQHVTKEISILPAWAAANKFSFHLITKEAQMQQDEKALPAHKLEGLINLAGEERAKEVEATLSAKAKEADEEGIERKEENTKPQEADATQQLVKAIEYLNEQVINLSKQVDELQEKEEEVKEEDEFDLVAYLKSKSVIGKDEAKVDGRSTLAKDAPAETETATPTQQQAGIPIGLVDQLIQANQQWADGGKQ